MNNNNTYSVSETVSEDTSGSHSIVTKPKIVSRLDATARMILLCMVFLLPLIAMPSSWLPLEMVKMSVLSIGTLLSLALWAIARLNEHTIEIPRSETLWASLLLVVGYAVAAILSSHVLQSLIGFGFERDTVFAVAVFMGVLFVAVLTTRSVGHVFQIQKAALASFLLLGVLQILRLAFGADSILPTVFSTDPTVTLLGSWNDLAALSGLAILTALSGLALFSSRMLVRTVLYAVLAVGVFLLAAVNVSAVWAALAVTTLLLAIYVFSVASYDKENNSFVPRFAWSKLTPSLFVLFVSIVLIGMGATTGSNIATQTGVT